MPVSFTVAQHKANPVKSQPHKSANTAEDILQKIWESKQQWSSAELLQTSLKGSITPDSIHAEGNGFVETVMTAYNGHHHLMVRPDDVWIAILVQFNFYVNNHAEELRSQFVKHKGKKELNITAQGNRYTVDFGDLAGQMTQEIHKNVVDEDLRNWILPNFSTTTSNDTTICAIVMMATMKAYFDYSMGLMCGIPSVTLEGEKEDWEKILARLDKLPSFGPEPAAWVTLLRPILRRFVQAFEGEPDVDFWGRVCHHQSFGSGPVYLSGWITAFCVWSAEGKWQGPPLALLDPPPQYYGHQPTRIPQKYPPGSRLFLDGILYPVLDLYNDIPIGICDVDVKLNDNGQVFNCMMVAGHVGCLIEGENKDTVRSLPAWFMFVKGGAKEDPSSQLMSSISDLRNDPDIRLLEARRRRPKRGRVWHWGAIFSCFKTNS